MQVSIMKSCCMEHTKKICHFITDEFKSSKDYIIKHYRDTNLVRLIELSNEERQCFIVIERLHSSLMDVTRKIQTEIKKERIDIKKLHSFEREIDNLFEDRMERIEILLDDTCFDNLTNYMYRKIKRLLLTYQANFIRPLRYHLCELTEKQEKEKEKELSEIESEPEENADICVVCQYAMKKNKSVILNCGHSFHVDCTYEILSRKLPCPVCRKSTSS